MNNQSVTIVDHRVKIVRYPVQYVSKEFVLNPDGSKQKNVHGTYEMRKIKEVKTRDVVKYIFTVETGEEIVMLTSIAFVSRFGKKTYNRCKRQYKQMLRIMEKNLKEASE